MVMVPVVLAPPVIVTGKTLKLDMDAGFTVNLAEVLAPLYVAVRVTVLDVDTGLVVTGTEIDDLPVGTVTFVRLGTTPKLLLAICTTAPPAGARYVSATVAVTVLPPTTVPALRFNEPRLTSGTNVTKIILAASPAS
jgi:hypothetical protein